MTKNYTLVYVSLIFIITIKHSSMAMQNDLTIITNQVNYDNVNWNTISSKFLNKIYCTMKNLTFNTQIIDENKGMYHILYTMESYSRIYDSSSIWLSFTDGHAEKIVSSFLNFEDHNILITTRANQCATMSQYTAQLGCHDSSANYQSLIVTLATYLHPIHVHIISTDNDCFQLFGEELMKKLFPLTRKNTDDTHHRVSEIQHLIFSPSKLNMRTLNEIMFTVKINRPSVVICLFDQIFYDLIFSAAIRYGVNGFEHIWLTINFPEHSISPSVVLPVQLITVRQSDMVSTNRYVDDVIAHDLINQTISLHSDWLLCSNKTQSTRSPINKPTDCIEPSSVPLSMYYRNSTDGSWATILEWEHKDGFAVHKQTSELMRSIKPTMPGVRLRIVTIIDAPFTISLPHLYIGDNDKPCQYGLLCRLSNEDYNVNESDSKEWDVSCCVGHSIDLLELLMEDLQFQSDIYIVEDGYYGAQKNGFWSGMVGDVQRGLADMAFAGLTINKERSSVIHFSEPFMRVDVGIITLADEAIEQFINFQFVQPLSHELWFCIFIAFLVGTVVIYLFENRNVFYSRCIEKETGFHFYSWREGFSYFSGLTFQRDLGGKNPNHYGARVAALSFSFSMVIIMTTYTAVLTAVKVSEVEVNSFKGLQDERMRNPTPAFGIATVANTSTDSFFRDVNDVILQRLYFFMQNYNVQGTREGIEKMMKRELGAFINDYPFLNYYISQQRECRLYLVGEPLAQAGYGVAMGKDSPWKQQITESILFLKESGKLEALKTKWIPNICLKNSTTTEATLEELPISYFGGLILILGSSIIVSFLILIVEHIYYRYHKHVIDPIQGTMRRLTTSARSSNGIAVERDQDNNKTSAMENQFNGQTC